MDQDDEDDEFIGQCLIEGFAYSQIGNGNDDWDSRRGRIPLGSASSIGTRFRHCSAPPMLMLLAPRIALLFDDDDDDNEENYVNIFMGIFTYLRDYCSINRTELTANRRRTIDRCLETLEFLLPEIAQLKNEEIPIDDFHPAMNDDEIDQDQKPDLHQGLIILTTDRREEDHSLAQISVKDHSFDQILVKQDAAPVVSDHSKDEIISDEDEWEEDDDAGWARVTTLSVRKEREILFSADGFTVLLNPEVDPQRDVCDKDMASLFPNNDLSSDSDGDDSVFEDPNRQFEPEWGAVAFLAEGIASDPERILPKQGTEIDKRPLGELFHENCSDADPVATNSKKLQRLPTAPKARSNCATSLLVKNNQKKYLLFEKTVTAPKIELSAPYRPWNRIRHELYANAAVQPFSNNYIDMSDVEDVSKPEPGLDTSGPPAIISVPMSPEHSFAMPPAQPIRPRPARPRIRKKSLPEATLALLKRHLVEALSSFNIFVNKPSPSHKAKQADVAVPNLPIPVDVKPVIIQSRSAPQSNAPPTNINKSVENPSQTSSKKSNLSPTSRLLSANPVSIDACLRAGHNYLQLLMTWVQKNYGSHVSKPSDTIQAKRRGESFIGTFHLKVDPPLKMEAMTQSSSKKAAKHEVARQSVLYIQRKRLGPIVKFSQRRVDSRFDKMAMSAVSSSEGDDSDSGSCMDIASDDGPPPVNSQPERARPPEPMIRVKQEPPDPVPVSSDRTEVLPQAEPPWKRSRSASFQVQHYPLPVIDQYSSALSRQHSNENPQLGSSVTSSNSVSNSSFVCNQGFTDVTVPQFNHFSNGPSFSQISPVTQNHNPAAFPNNEFSSELAPGPSKSDTTGPAYLPSPDTIRPASSPSVRPVVSPSALQCEARSFLDSLSPPSVRLSVAKKPGDPFIIYLEDESCSDEELEMKHSKLNSIKTELMLLKEKIARAEALKGLQKREDSQH